ncbi:hypothetical protein, partial [Lysinibacillus sp. NPDC056185]|uniref:hypothetical protein n=1 Tax=Lysinibacillus sp. NPDC056185 TaxID=3345739 RepID=UPI0039F017B0
MWPDVAVRGAGFPVDDLLRLGRPELAAAEAELDDADFREAYAAAVDASCADLAEVTGTGTFRAAMLWQNRQLVERALDKYRAGCRDGAPRTKRRRQQEN